MTDPVFEYGRGRRAAIRIARRLAAATLAFLIVAPTPAFANDPVVSTVVTKDLNRNGRIDQLVVTFQTAPSSEQAAAGKFAVADYDVEAATHVNGSTEVKLTLTEKAAADTGATPRLTYNLTQLAPATTDGARPVLLGASGDDFGAASHFNAVRDMVTLTFSEQVALKLPGSTASLTPKDRHLAVERAIVIGGPLQSCPGDGDGVPAPLGTGSNFPQLSAGATGVSSPDDPIVVSGSTITITQRPNNDGSSAQPNRRFSVLPASFGTHCTAGISSASTADGVSHAQHIQDVAGNAVVQAGSGATKIFHVRGLLDAAPLTLDANADGRLDGVRLTFNHPVDLPSAQRALLANRLSVKVGSVEATNLAAAAGTTASQLTVSFTAPAGWNTAVRPVVQYDGSGDCLATGILVTTVTGLQECAESISGAQSDDAAAPVILSARTRDAADGAANGKIDAVELTFSEPVRDSTFSSTGAGWSVAGYTVSGFSTGATADDTIVVLTFGELSTPDTGARPAVGYTAPAGPTDPKVSDAAGNLLVDVAGVVSADGAGPVLVGGTVFDELSADVAGHDGRVDEALVTFSEPINDASRVANKITVGNIAATVVKDTPINADDTRTANDATFTVAVAAGVPGTGAKDLAALGGAVADAAGNIAPAATVLSTGVADKAKPVVLSVSPQGQAAEAKTLTLTFSEAMDTTQAPIVAFGPDQPYTETGVPAVAGEAHTNGYRNDDASKWEGVAPGGGICGDPLGCVNHLSVRNAKGADGNAQAIEPDTHLTWTIDVVAPEMPEITSPQSGAALGTDGEPANIVITGTASEPGLTIEAIVDGGAPRLGTSNASNVWSIAVPLSIGQHTLRVRAVDAGGNASATTNERTFFVKENTSISLLRNFGRIAYGATSRLSGRLTAADGSPIAGERLALHQRPAGSSAWSNAGFPVTDDNGAFTLDVRPTVNTEYRVIYGGSSQMMPAFGTPLTIEVIVKIPVKVSASTIRLGNRVTISGNVLPDHRYQTVYLQQYTSRGWRTIGSATLGRYSNYAFSIQPPTRGTFQYRLYFPTDTRNIGGYSGVAKVRVV